MSNELINPIFRAPDENLFIPITNSILDISSAYDFLIRFNDYSVRKYTQASGSASHLSEMKI